MSIQAPGSQPSSVQTMRPSIPPIRSSIIPNTNLPGFYIGSDADISARDIPADGSISFFPYKDLSRIVIKQWNGNVLESAVYALQMPTAQQNQQQGSAPPLPPPPPPMNQQQANHPQNQQEPSSDPAMVALLESFKQMNAGLAGAMGQLGNSMQAIQDNLEKLNGRFTNEGGMG